MSRKNVTRCICHSRSFDEIKKYAEENHITSVVTLQDQEICSGGCGMCAPYVELMLQTGETAFEASAFYRRKKEQD